MINLVRYIAFFLAALLCVFLASAQQGFYVPAAGKIFFVGDSATIFSNVNNQGNLGIGKNATVNFSGKNWSNSTQARITDNTSNGTGVTGEGGWVRFISDSLKQQISGGYNAATHSGPSFTKIKIDNKQGIELLDGSTKTRNEISFEKGQFYLNDNILVLGNNNPGKIGGYDSARYFVTGNHPDRGLLIRENVRRSDGLVVFPVGTKSESYTPAAIRNITTTGDDYFVSVFDSVKANGLSGRTLIKESVNKTWQIGKSKHPNSGGTEVTLQHIVNDEGTAFADHRNFAYVSQSVNGRWDTSHPQTKPGPGAITTGSPLSGSGMNTRLLIASVSQNSLFTKFAGNNDTAKGQWLWFNAYRLDSMRVRTYWKTNPEININHFVVERRLSTETDFKPVGNLMTQAPSGYSVSTLNYQLIDIPNKDKGISFYRLRSVRNDNSFTFSDTVAVAPYPGEYNINVWPNPSTGNFFVSIHKTLPAKAIVVWNAIGQKVLEVSVNGRSIIPMYLPIQGAYFVGIVLSTGEIIETRKLIIAGR
jgi:hypothetical protein